MLYPYEYTIKPANEAGFVFGTTTAPVQMMVMMIRRSFELTSAHILGIKPKVKLEIHLWGVISLNFYFATTTVFPNPTVTRVFVAGIRM